MRSWHKYIDEYALPVGVYHDGRLDGGDTAQRVGMMGVAYATPDKICPADIFETPFALPKAMTDLEVVPGMLVRHRTSSRVLKDMTRDNQRPLTQAMMLWKEVSVVNDCLHRVFYVHKTNKFMYPSGDISGPSVLADYVRGGLLSTNKFTKWLSLLTGDLDLLFTCVVQIVISFFDIDNVDRSQNIINTLRFNQLTELSFVGRIAHFLYTGMVFGGAEFQMKHYFREQEANSPYSTSPPMNELWQVILDENFKPWHWPQEIL